MDMRRSIGCTLQCGVNERDVMRCDEITAWTEIGVTGGRGGENTGSLVVFGQRLAGVVDECLRAGSCFE